MRERIKLFVDDSVRELEQGMNKFLEKTEGTLRKIETNVSLAQSGTYSTSVRYFGAITYIPGPELEYLPEPQRQEEPRATRRIQILGEDE